MPPAWPVETSGSLFHRRPRRQTKEVKVLTHLSFQDLGWTVKKMFIMSTHIWNWLFLLFLSVCNSVFLEVLLPELIISQPEVFLPTLILFLSSSLTFHRLPSIHLIKPLIFIYRETSQFVMWKIGCIHQCPKRLGRCVRHGDFMQEAFIQCYVLWTLLDSWTVLYNNVNFNVNNCITTE